MNSHHSFSNSLHELREASYERGERRKLYGGYVATVPEWYEMTSVRDRMTYTQCAWMNFFRVAATVAVLTMKKAARSAA